MKKIDLANEPQGLERPLPSEGKSVWGSDAIAEIIRALDIPYVALNPGSSYRGLHDSLVNKLGNERPQMLLCLHEEAAVAVAHGWAKVTEKPMLAVVHANVGLMHGIMAVYNAWCDRTPLVLLGANGPADATQRRPWIDWIHTTRDNGALLRNFTKWDDQPASIGAAYESILRARKIAATTPRGPTYVVLDVGLQEIKLDAAPPLPDVKRYLPPAPVGPRARARRGGRAPPPRRRAAAHPDGPGQPQRSRLGAPRAARRGAGRGGAHRSEARRRLPDRPSAARFAAGHVPERPRRRAHPPGRRDPHARLGRSRRHVQERVQGRCRPGDDHQRVARPASPSRLEHGLPGPAAGRSADHGRHRSDRRGDPRRRDQIRQRQEGDLARAQADDASHGRDGRRGRPDRRADARRGDAAGGRGADDQPHPPSAVMGGASVADEASAWTISAATAAAASARAPAPASARPWPCATAAGSRSRSSATAIS